MVGIYLKRWHNTALCGKKQAREFFRISYKERIKFNSDLSISMELIYFSFLMHNGVIKLVVCTGG